MLRTNLTPDYSVSRIIKGGWQLAGGHGYVDPRQAVQDMFEYYDAGITTFDCADIYIGVESMIGNFLKELAIKRGSGERRKVQVHTKYVPDRQQLGKLSSQDVKKAVHRSLKRLGVEQLDLVQFHWWDFNVPQYVEVGQMLNDLRQSGEIRNIGLTNFDTEHTAQMLDAGINILTNQVQYSVLDRRPEKTFQSFCKGAGVTMLCYGGLAGGFISEKYLNVQEPNAESINTNRSLIKYKLIIDDLGGWDIFQRILYKLKDIGAKHGLSISETAILYVLSKPQVSAVIVGSRNNQHTNSLKNIGSAELTDLEIAEIDKASQPSSIAGDIYSLERGSEKHARIMKYNLNSYPSDV